MSVNHAHAGRYVCMVINSLGNMFESFSLTVKGNQIVLNHNYVFKPEWLINASGVNCDGWAE